MGPMVEEMEVRDGPSGTATAPRGSAAVAASILSVVLLGGYFAASPGDVGGMPAEFAVNAVILILVFWFPAMRIEAPGDVLRSWKSLLPWLLAWTLVWDLASSGIVGDRDLLNEWWLVYPAGVAVVGVLLMLHGFVLARTGPAREEAGRDDTGRDDG
jgi:hypothetical protein